MTTLQKITLILLAAGALTAGFYLAHRNSELRSQVQALEQEREQLTGLSKRIEQLQRERDHATNALAAIEAENASLKKSPSETLKLRGEVGRLRQENATITSRSALSQVTATPEARKMLRDQQKLGMGTLYKGLAQRLKLSSEQTGQLNDLLADHIMDNVDLITTTLHDKTAPEQVNQLFDAQEKALQTKLEALLGPEGLTQYQDYSKNLLGKLTADQFKGLLTGDDAARAEKIKQLAQTTQDEAQAALASAGLPPDYQTVPILNFRNIASEQQQDNSLKLLEDIYQRVAARGSSFLNETELAKFQEFKTTAVSQSRALLSMNRMMMAPISK